MYDSYQQNHGQNQTAGYNNGYNAPSHGYGNAHSQSSQNQWQGHHSQNHGYNGQGGHGHNGHHGQGRHGNGHHGQHPKDIDPSFRPPFWPMIDLLKKYKPHDFTQPATVRGGEYYQGAIQMPYVIDNPAQDAFRTAAGYWQRDIDWMKWSDGRTGKWLLSGDANTIERASKEDLGALMTAMCRSDRFCEGSLAGFCERGFVWRILKRVEAIKMWEKEKYGHKEPTEVPASW